jgi:hypothetical protein
VAPAMWLRSSVTVGSSCGGGEFKAWWRRNSPQSPSLFQGVMSRVYLGCIDVVQEIVGFCFISFIHARLHHVGRLERWAATQSGSHLSILTVG